MKIGDIITAANTYTDENFNAQKVIIFINDAISIINAELNTILPLISINATPTDVYTSLATTWINAVIIPYVCHSIKLNDSALDEADRFYLKFQEGLLKLKDNKFAQIEDIYKTDEFETIYIRDLEKGINKGWFK